MTLQKTLSERRLLFPIILVAVSFAVYCNAISNDFVYDDSGQILTNPWITNVKFIPVMFSKSVWAFQQGIAMSNYYRPMMHLIYLCNYHIFGLSPWGFHLVNILLHAGVTVLVFAITSFLINSRSPAPVSSSSFSFLAALLFATHPIHTEAVTWIAGLPELSFTFFSLLSFYFYMRRTDNGPAYNVFYILSLTMFFLSTLCKETALTLLLIIIIYDYVFEERTGRPLRQLVRYIPYIAVAGGYLLLRIHALGGFAPEMRYARLNTYQYVINVFPLFMQYLEKLLFPVDLNAFYVFHPIKSLLEVRGILSLLTLAGFIALLFIASKKNKIFFFSLLLIAVPLFPVFYIRGLGVNTFTERYLYMPSIGFVMIIALFLTQVRRNKPALIISLAAFLSIVGLYAMGTVSRNSVWKDEFSLYSDMVDKSPDGALPRLNLGALLVRMGQPDEAIRHLQISLMLDPGYAATYAALGAAYYNKGWIEPAIGQYKMALAIDPKNVKAHTDLGLAYASEGLIDQAILQYQFALSINPYNAETNYRLGLAYREAGQMDKAIEHFQAAVRLDPNDSMFRRILSEAYEEQKTHNR